MMFDKKEMKMVDYKKAQRYLLDGEPVYLIQLDGSLLEVTADLSWEKLLFHNLRGGGYAVHRKKFTGVGTFTKNIHVGKWCFAVSHTEKGGEC